MDSHNVWDSILARVETKINRHSFYTWYKPSSYLSESGDLVRVRVPNAVFRDWLTKHYAGLINEAMAELDRPMVKIEFVAETPSAGPLPTMGEAAPTIPADEVEEAEASVFSAGPEESLGTAGGLAASAYAGPPPDATPDVGLNLRYTFDTFVVGPSNQFAEAASRAVAEAASTLNTSLAPSVPALPSQSLDGSTDTYNGNVKVTYTPMDGLRLNAIYAWDVRDNETAVQAYPAVATDMFLDPALRSNTPFSLTPNRFKLNGDYRGPGTWKLSGGIDWDNRERTYTEVVNTLETTLWGRASVQALENVGVSFNLAHAERDPSTYGVSYWFPPENPLMRKTKIVAR